MRRSLYLQAPSHLKSHAIKFAVLSSVLFYGVFKAAEQQSGRVAFSRHNAQPRFVCVFRSGCARKSFFFSRCCQTQEGTGALVSHCTVRISSCAANTPFPADNINRRDSIIASLSVADQHASQRESGANE